MPQRSHLAFARLVTIGVVVLSGAALQGQQPTAALSLSAVRSTTTGEELYRAACATCHGIDGTGVPRELVGFAQELPDFTDCAFATPEPSADWAAVVHEGGPIRGLDRHMPAFGDALTGDEIQRVVAYVSTFCSDAAWPRGDLNLPRPFFTEKAYPENEAVVTTSFASSGRGQVHNALLFERRIGKRNQIEVVVPIDAVQRRAGVWTAGIGDVAIGFKRALYASVNAGRILSAGGEIALPTGSASSGLGSGITVVEPFVLFGQALGATGFVQAQAAFEWPADRTHAPREAVVRAAVGNSFLQDRGFGRAWTPTAELLWARPEGSASEWDVVPQLQVTLSKLQHVAVAAGVRIPLNDRDQRRPQVVTYFLWDWFDGSLFDFWK